MTNRLLKAANELFKQGNLAMSGFDLGKQKPTGTAGPAPLGGLGKAPGPTGAMPANANRLAVNHVGARNMQLGNPPNMLQNVAKPPIGQAPPNRFPGPSGPAPVQPGGQAFGQPQVGAGAGSPPKAGPTATPTTMNPNIQAAWLDTEPDLYNQLSDSMAQQGFPDPRFARMDIQQQHDAAQQGPVTGGVTMDPNPQFAGGGAVPNMGGTTMGADPAAAQPPAQPSAPSGADIVGPQAAPDPSSIINAGEATLGADPAAAQNAGAASELPGGPAATMQADPMAPEAPGASEAPAAPEASQWEGHRFQKQLDRANAAGNQKEVDRILGLADAGDALMGGDTSRINQYANAGAGHQFSQGAIDDYLASRGAGAAGPTAQAGPAGQAGVTELPGLDTGEEAAIRQGVRDEMFPRGVGEQHYSGAGGSHGRKVPQTKTPMGFPIREDDDQITKYNADLGIFRS